MSGLMRVSSMVFRCRSACTSPPSPSSGVVIGASSMVPTNRGSAGATIVRGRRIEQPAVDFDAALLAVIAADQIVDPVGHLRKRHA